jgi:eukaryotic-like serine/threonine-protein kinase
LQGGSQPVPARSLTPDEQLGPYRLIACIGEGGMSEVWKARDTRLNRIVAVKVIKSGFSGRFEQEARAISALSHPHICMLYDIGRERGFDFLILEYVAGSPLRGPLPVPKALHYAVQIADALDAAHRSGIIHRDLKPANILLTKSGVKLLDFGLATMNASGRENDATVSLVDEAAFVGTPQYMAPEQLAGAEVDARTDLWAFGCVLYEVLTGKYAFSGPSTVSIAAAILNGHPTPLSQLYPEIPLSVERIINACLMKDPENRFQTARDLKRDLTWAAMPSDKRRPQGIESEPKLSLRSFTSNGGIVEHPSFSPDGKQVVFSWDGPSGGSPNLYLKLIDVDDILRLTSGDAADLAPAWSPDGSRIAFLRDCGNGEAMLMTISPLGGNQRKVAAIAISLDRVSGSLTWTPDSKYLITSEQIGDAYALFLIPVSGGEKVQLTELGSDESKSFGSGDGSPAVSANGDKLAFVRVTGSVQSRLMWMPLDADYRPASPPNPVETGFVTHMSVRWARNGNHLLIAAGAGARGHLYLTSIEGDPNPDQLLPALDCTAVELHQVTGKILCQSPEQTINLWELPVTTTGQVARDAAALTSTRHINTRPIYSPDGNWIAFTSTRTGNPGVWLMDRAGSRIMRLPVPESAVSVASDWSPDSRSVLLFSNPNKQYDIFSIEVETGSIRQVTDDPANDWRGHCSRDGRWIYFTSSRNGRFQLWRMPIGGGQATVVTNRSASSAQESPDGRWLYYAEYPRGGLYRMPLLKNAHNGYGLDAPPKGFTTSSLSGGAGTVPCALPGGPEEQVLPHILDAESYAVARSGIYYLVPLPDACERRYSLGVPFARSDLRFLNTETGQDDLLMRFVRPIYGGLSLSPDEQSLAYAEIERDTQELVLIENFH